MSRQKSSDSGSFLGDWFGLKFTKGKHQKEDDNIIECEMMDIEEINKPKSSSFEDG